MGQIKKSAKASKKNGLAGGRPKIKNDNDEVDIYGEKMPKEDFVLKGYVKCDICDHYTKMEAYFKHRKTCYFRI